MLRKSIFKKILLGLVVIGVLGCSTAYPEDMDPVSGVIIWSTACAAGTLIGAAGVESYNQLTQDPSVPDTTITNTMDVTMTLTNERN